MNSVLRKSKECSVFRERNEKIKKKKKPGFRKGQIFI